MALERLSGLGVARGILIIGCMYMEAAVERSSSTSVLATGAMRTVRKLRSIVLGNTEAADDCRSTLMYGDGCGGRVAVVHYLLFEDVVGL